MNKKGLSLRDLMRNQIISEEIMFRELVSWGEEEFDEYSNLLDLLVDSSKNKTKENNIKTTEKGKALEQIVNFIIEKTFILSVHPNKHTATNEIDQIIYLNDYGKQFFHKNKITFELAGLEQDYLLGECKNYNDKAGSTWVGKFYSLLKSCGECRLGVIFSYHGLTGKENSFQASHGLTKLIYRIESDTNKVFILDFNKNDFKMIRDEKDNFFEIIKRKKVALKTNTDSQKLRIPHEAEEIFKKEFSQG